MPRHGVGQDIDTVIHLQAVNLDADKAGHAGDIVELAVCRKGAGPGAALVGGRQHTGGGHTGLGQLGNVELVGDQSATDSVCGCHGAVDEALLIKGQTGTLDIVCQGVDVSNDLDILTLQLHLLAVDREADGVDTGCVRKKVAPASIFFLTLCISTSKFRRP